MRRSLFLFGLPEAWNVKVHTLEDFYVYCAAHSITVCEEHSVAERGLYIPCDGMPTIYLDCDLRGHEKTKAALHELGHYLFHPGGIHGYEGKDSGPDYEADVFAVCAMIPRTVLRSHGVGEIIEEYGYSIDLIEFRQEILDIWRI